MRALLLVALFGLATSALACHSTLTEPTPGVVEQSPRYWFVTDVTGLVLVPVGDPAGNGQPTVGIAFKDVDGGLHHAGLRSGWLFSWSASNDAINGTKDTSFGAMHHQPQQTHRSAVQPVTHKQATA